ncbi:MAG: hypothetical protein AAF579_02460 [Cyanobacteria bacterium P01_C01_bin.118]
MQDYQLSQPEQTRIHQRLGTLVGPGAAAFYKDACYLMEMEIPLESKTHLIGHLLREIEASLRGVVKFLWKQDIIAQGNNPDDISHKEQIELAVQTLEISKPEIIETWRKLPKGKYNLAKRAHRSNLEPVRRVDSEFSSFWEEIDDLFQVILDQLETKVAKIQSKLDDILVKSEPGKADIKCLRSEVPNSKIAIGYFFSKLDSPAWLKPLYKAGFFTSSSELLLDNNNKYAPYSRWGQTKYLIKVAPDEPDLALEISIQILNSGSNNISIYEDLVEVALHIPSDYASRWCTKAINWLKQQNVLSRRLPDLFGQLVTHLSDADHIDVAFDLAKELLAVLPSLEDSNYGEPHTRIQEEFHYKRILDEHLQPLIELRSELVLNFLCELLDTYLSFTRYSNNSEKNIEDHSNLWLPIIDGKPKRKNEIKQILAISIWEISTRIASGNPSQLEMIFQDFRDFDWRIFDRFSLHLLRRYPEHLSIFVDKLLLESNRYDWLGFYRDGTSIEYSHEHALLLREQFEHRSSEIQDQILCLLLCEPSDINKVSPDKQSEYVKYWRRDWLSIVQEWLPGHLKRLYRKSIEELGDPRTLEDIFTNLTSYTWQIASSSPKSQEELAELAENNIHDLFSYLKKYQTEGSQLSLKDLAWQLSEGAIAPSPQKFVENIAYFQELDKIFSVWFLRGLKKNLENPSNRSQINFLWNPILDLCTWLMGDLTQVTVDSDSNEYPSRTEICRVVIEIVELGLSLAREQIIPVTLREQFWGIIKPLTRDLDVTPGFTVNYQDAHGPYFSSRISVRGLAMHAVMRYAFWIKQDINSTTNESQSFNDMPEVQKVLEWHLIPENDPSNAIRAVYGKWVPSLLRLAPDWTQQNINRIFPEELNSQNLFNAAWEGYLKNNRVYSDILFFLEDQYRYAINQLPDINSASKNKSKHYHLDLNRYLANHLLNLF